MFQPNKDLNPLQEYRYHRPKDTTFIHLLGMIVGMGITLPILSLILLIFNPVLLSEESPKNSTAITPDKKNPKKAKLEVVESKALQQIVKESGLSEQAKITVCTLKRYCWHHRGNELPASAASLVKVPIAVALMNKVVNEKISLETSIYLDPGNFTEDASELIVEQNYPLWKLLAEMIVHSSNIAPNQLIDYMGWDYINKVLENHGYEKTRVYAKFTGESIVPSDPGSDNNSLTTDELSEMMMEIYRRDRPGDNILIALLKYQRDRELGYAALEGSPAQWLGEKTGQNSLVLGTTLAMQIGKEKYVLTVLDDGYYSDVAIRSSITKIANHLAKNGQL